MNIPVLYEMIMILSGTLALYELKARIDAIGFSNIKDKGDRRTWHIEAWFYIFIVTFMVAEGYGHGINKYFAYVVLYMGLMRASFFPIRLNKLRNKGLDWHHLGSEGWDKLARWVFKQNTKLYFIVTSILAIISAVLLWMDQPKI